MPFIGCECFGNENSLGKPAGWGWALEGSAGRVSKVIHAWQPLVAQNKNMVDIPFISRMGEEAIPHMQALTHF